MAQKKKKTNKTNKSTQTRNEVLNNTMYQTDMKKTIKCIAIVLIIFGLMYLLTVLIVNNSKSDYIKKENEKTSIQYSEILAGTSFSKKEKEYLVLFYNVKEDKNKTYGDILSNYQAKDEHLPIYYVDLGSALNKNVISDESNSNATQANELKIKGATLIKFINGNIEEYLEGKEEISNYLQ